MYFTGTVTKVMRYCKIEFSFSNRNLKLLKRLRSRFHTHNRPVAERFLELARPPKSELRDGHFHFAKRLITSSFEQLVSRSRDIVDDDSENKGASWL